MYTQKMNENDKVKIVILAAGKGTRMKSELPKVLVKFNGKPMIRHLLDSVHKANIDDKPVIVVGYKKEEVMKELGDKHQYAIQEEQLGTGHAVMSTEKLLKNKSDHVMVLYGDSPFVSSETIKKLIDKHILSNGTITMATIKLEDFQDWRKCFYTSFSRIIRNKNGEIVKDVQFRDTNDEEKKITEVNPCYFIFNAEWLWKKLRELKTDNDQKQYLLPDLIKIAMQEREKIESIVIDPHEGLAVNSKEELEILEKLVK